MTLEELEKRIFELSRIHAATHDEDVKADLEKLRKQVAKMEERLLTARLTNQRRLLPTMRIHARR